MVQAKPSVKSATEASPATGTLAIQLVDGFSRQPIEGAQVCFGYKAEVAPGEPSFRHDDEDYRIVLSLPSDAEGWVLFKSAHLWRGEACAICVTAPGYRPAFSKGRDVLTGEVMPVRADDEVVATALLVPEELRLGEDLGASALAYLASLSSVRVRVLQGANFGNQSAALALVQTLRLAGYRGAIRLLCDPAPRIEEQQIQADLTFLAEDDQESSLLSLQGALEKRIQAAHEGRVTFREPREAAPAPPTLDQPDKPNPIGGDAPPTLDELTRRLAAFKDGLLAQLKSERDKAAPASPKARLRRACEIDLSDRPSPFTLTELAALMDSLVPFGLSAYELRENAEVQKAAGLCERPGGVPVVVSVEITVRTRGDVSVMDKLRILRPDLTTARDLEGVEWLAATRFDEDLSRDPTVLGFVPAGEDYSDAHLGKIQREELKTGCVLALEPFSWFPEKRSMCLPESRPEPLCLPHAATYQLAPLVPAAPGELIAGLCAASNQAALTAPLTALFELATARKVDLMTVYGLHQAKRSPVNVVVDNLIASLVAVQQRRGRPTVILVVYARDDLASQIIAPGATYTRAAEALPRLGEVKGGEVLICHAPMLPQAVFQLFCQASALPLLLEGANTTNLAQMLGLPYLSIASTDTDYMRLAGPACPDYRRLKRCEDELNQAPAPGLDDAVPRRTHLEEYLTDTLTHGAQAMGGYFARLQRHVQRSEQNQVLLGLYRLVTELKARERPPADAAPRRILSVGELPEPAVARQ